jgi:hypothetical protein
MENLLSLFLKFACHHDVFKTEHNLMHAIHVFFRGSGYGCKKERDGEWELPILMIRLIYGSGGLPNVREKSLRIQMLMRITLFRHRFSRFA